MDIDSSSDSYSMFDDIDIDVIRKRLASSFNYTNSSTSTDNTEDCPAGLRVLVVDDDASCLFVSSRMLKKFKYEVTGVGSGKEALEKLREKPGHFDLVVTDLHMPEMNGLQLLRRIKRKYAALPVLLMSGDIKSHMVTRALEHGAGYYLYKPLTYSDIEKLWQHIVKSKVNQKVSEENMEQTTSVSQDSSKEKHKTSTVDILSSSEGSSSIQKSRKRKEPTKEQSDVGKRCRARSAAPAPKKPRVVWTAELHNHFLDAIEKLGVERGVPKKILEYMRFPGLTRENVASHLQKYRIFVKKLVENNRFIEPSTVKSLASRAFQSSFASDEPMPVNIQKNLSQEAPKYSFGSIQSGSEDDNFQGVNTQTHTSHLGASMVAAGFQLGHSSINPLYRSKDMASAQQPWPTTSVAAGNVSCFNHQNNANNRSGNQKAVSIGPSLLHVSVPMGGGRSGRGTMKLVHQQNLMKWRNNVPSSGPLNTAGTRSVFEGLNFQRQINNAVVGNFGTTGSIGSSFVGNSAQPSTFNSSNFTGIQIINNNPNSRGTLHIGPIVSKPSNDNSFNNNNINNNIIINNNMDYGFTNNPISSVMELPGLIPEFPSIQSSYSAIEVPNLIPDYLNNQPSSAEPINVSNPIPGYSCMTTTGFRTSLQNEASFGNGLILNENHEFLAPQQENQVPATPVAPAPLVLEAQEPEQAGEDEEDPFEGLYDLVRNDPNLGNNSFPTLLEDENFADFFQDFEQSTADQGGAMYDDENFIDPDFDIRTGGVNNGDDDDIFRL